MSEQSWEKEAERYSQNDDYWRDRAEKAEAELARRDEKIADLRKDYGDCKDAIARRDEIIKKLKEDAEMLANTMVFEVYPGNLYACSECGESGKDREFEHKPDCPFTLHRALMKELG